MSPKINKILYIIAIASVIFYVYQYNKPNSNKNKTKKDDDPTSIILCGQKQKINTIDEYCKYLDSETRKQYKDAINFIKKILPYVKGLHNKTKIPWQVIIAQACLESNYGKNEIIDSKTKKATYNIFGVKYNPERDNQFVEVQTEEENDGIKSSITCKFAKYNSYQESFESYKKVMLNEYFNHAINNSSNPTLYIKDIQSELPNENHPKYATDSQYSEKIIQIMKNLKMI